MKRDPISILVIKCNDTKRDPISIFVIKCDDSVRARVAVKETYSYILSEERERAARYIYIYIYILGTMDYWDAPELWIIRIIRNYGLLGS